MAVGSGIGSSFGVVAESAYGTPVPVTRHLPGTFNVKRVQETVEVTGVAAGRPAAPDEVVTKTQAVGRFDGQLTTRQMGIFLQHLFGGNAAPVQQGATTAYLQTHVLSDNKGKSLTCQAGIADTGGTVRPYTLTGGKITQAEFSCGVGEALTIGVDIDGRELVETESLVAPSFLSGLRPFHFAQMSVKLGAYGSEAAVTGVRKVSVNISRSQDVDAFYAGNAGKKSEPTWNDFIAITGSIDIDFVTKADFVDRFMAHTSTSLDWSFTGPIIASTYAEMFQLRLAKVYFNTEAIPEVQGPGVNQVSVPFKAFWDPTNGIASAGYQSLDTAV
jgi:hypothetical protein